jgi:hypothetical protein
MLFLLNDFVSHLEDLDLTNNPICENIELKFLITNLVPDIRYINRAPLKVDPNIYGYSQVAPGPSRADQHDSFSEITVPQSRVRSTGISSEESSLNNAISAENIGQVMQGNHLARPPTFHAIPEEEDVEQLDSPPRTRPSSGPPSSSAAPQSISAGPVAISRSKSASMASSVPTARQATRQGNASPQRPPPPPPAPAPRTISPDKSIDQTSDRRQSRLPWRNPPNPLPRNWNQSNQSIVSSAKKKKLSSTSTAFDQSLLSVDGPGQDQLHKSRSLDASIRRSSSGPLDPRLASESRSLFPESQQDFAATISSELFDAPSTGNNPALSQTGGQSLFTRTQSMDTIYPGDSSSTIPVPPNSYNPNSRWISPELNRRNRSKSPEDLAKSYISLPFPDLSTQSKNPRRIGSPTNSPERGGNVGKFEKSSPTRSSYLWARSMEERHKSFERQREKELTSEAFVTMTEKQEKLLSRIRSPSRDEEEAAGRDSRSSSAQRARSRSSSGHHRGDLNDGHSIDESFAPLEAPDTLKKRSTTASSSSSARKENSFERLHKQGLHHFRRSSRNISSYSEKYEHQSSSSSPQKKKSSTGKENKQPSSSGGGRGGAVSSNASVASASSSALIPLETFLPPKEKEAMKSPKGKNGAAVAPAPDHISPYNRFLRLKEKIDRKYDHDIDKISAILGFPDDNRKKNPDGQDSNTANSRKKNYEFLKAADRNFNATNDPDDDFHAAPDEEEEEEEFSASTSTGMSLHHQREGILNQLRAMDEMSLHQQTVHTAPTYSSNMLSLDSLPPRPPQHQQQQQQQARTVYDLLNLLAPVNYPNGGNPQDHSYFEREALRLSQEMEQLKIKKLQEISTNTLLSSQQSIHDIRNPVYLQAQHHHPVQVLQEASQTQQKQLAHHLHYIRDMLQLARDNYAGQQDSPSTDQPRPQQVAGESMMLPSMAFLPADRSAQVQQEQKALSAIRAAHQPVSSAPPPSAAVHAPPSQQQQQPADLKSRSMEVLDSINSQFDEMQIENLNFIEMNQAIETLRRNQMQTLQLLQKNSTNS